MLTATKRHQCERGVAAVEFAVVRPVIVLVILGTIEIAAAFLTQHALQEAAMNGCRLYAMGDRDKQEALNLIELSLQESGINNCTVQFSPNTKDAFNEVLQPIKVSLTVPHREVAVVGEWFMTGKEISASVILPADAPQQNDEPGIDDDDD